MRIFLCLFWLSTLSLALGQQSSSCVNMWDDDGQNPDVNICPVSTTDGENCEFPFVHNTVTYSTCIINGPQNPEKLPKCKISSGAWAECIVPNNAIIEKVTTKKASTTNSRYRRASLNGGTLVWIDGKRFGDSKFSTSQSSETTNMVILTSQFTSHVCTIFPDATIPTQITCFTEAMVEGDYLVQVQVNGNFIPYYQYLNSEHATIYALFSNTPTITEISPINGPPGTMIDIKGDFKTSCFLRDEDGCADDAGSRITRVYVGAQQCELIDPLTNELFQDVTKKSMRCRLDKPEVNYFRASIIVTNEYGRSMLLRNKDGERRVLLYVAPNERLYNFETYAEIDSISPQTGSTVGGTLLTITGKYLFHDENVPTIIDIAGTECEVVSYDRTQLPITKIVCKTASSVAVTSENYGNRGLTFITSDTYTNELDTVVVPGDAVYSTLHDASFIDTVNRDRTIWMKGYLYPSVSSTYEFTINSNGPSRLFISTTKSEADKVLIARGTSPTGTVDLEAFTYYYFEVRASVTGEKLSISMDGKMLNTVLTEIDSVFVENEIQNIKIDSTKVPEGYSINYTDWTTVDTAGNGQIQSVTVIPATPGDLTPFVLKFNGVSSAMLEAGATADQLKNALNDMPTLKPDLVKDVTREDVTDGHKYVIEFSPDLALISLLEETAGQVSSTIVKESDATTSGEKSQLVFDNVPSELFDLRDSANMIKGSIDSSFGIRCPESIISGSGALYDFEGMSYDDSAALNETAFCGKTASKGSILLLWNQNISMNNNYLCFAYRTKVPITQIYYSYIDPLFKTIIQEKINVVTIADEQWHYPCYDLYDAYLNTESGQTNGYSQNVLKVFGVYGLPVSPDLQFDAVSMKPNLPLGIVLGDNNMDLLNARRIIPAITARRNTLNVAKTGTVVNFEFQPENCLFNIDPIILANSFTDTIPVMASVSSASPPVTGDFSLTWNGHALNNIPADISANDLSTLFDSVPDFGSTVIIRTRDCAGFYWRIKWNKGGIKPLLTVATNNLSGNDVGLSIEEVNKGGASFKPVQGSMLRTLNEKPQVSVLINNIPSICANCDFEWTADATPEVTTIDTSLAPTITITGNGFDAIIKENNIVLLGELPCTINSATATSIECTTGENPVGTYTFTVSVLGKGLAQLSTAAAAVEVTFTLTVASLSPIIGSVGGGNILSISGTGFSPTATVTVDGNPCEIKSATYILIECIVPASSASEDLTVDIDVSGQIKSAAYTYDFTNSAIINSITPLSLSVIGGETITAIGTNLPLINAGVRLGGKIVTVVSSTVTELVLKSPALNPGIYQLELYVDQQPMGNARVNAPLEYIFYVTSFSPNVGSVRGGSLVTVLGGGFETTDCSKNEVKFGPKTCEILDGCTSAYVQCKTSDAFIVHEVDNSGSDPLYGKGYGWNTPYLTIGAGDSVRWSWKTPDGITGISYKVLQVADALSFTGTGFDSGEASASGTFQHQFNQPGIYYYWSGFVESTKVISFRGVVEVVASSDKELELTVRLNEIKAQKCVFPFTYNSVEYTSCTSVDSTISWCSPTSLFSGQKLPCDSTPPISPGCDSTALTLAGCSITSPLTTNYHMAFTTCDGSLPTISAVSSTSISSGMALTITGENFSATQCENEVYIGGILCPLDSSSVTSLVCTFGSGSELFPNYAHSIEVLVKNVGYAVQEGEFELQFIPVVSSFSPSTGSTTGGTTVTINGDGFIEGLTLVAIGEEVYSDSDFDSISSQSLVFETRSGVDETYDLKVFVNQAEASCSACEFTYSNAITPTITAVSPNSINGASTITITGTLFGTISDSVKVTLGTEVCFVETVTDTTISCTVNGLPAGAQLVKVKIIGAGNALNAGSLSVDSSLSITSISPSTGSIHGGLLVTVVGNGFSEDTTLMIASYDCEVFGAVSSSMLTCVTSEHAAGRSINNARAIDAPETITIVDGDNTVVSAVTFTYDTSLSPSVTSVSPSSGSSGTLTITGTQFGTVMDDISVQIGDIDCLLVSVADTSIVCTVSEGSAGAKLIVVTKSSVGNSNNDVQFTFDLNISSLSNTVGSLGGGLLLTITGTGFSSESTVTICGNSCEMAQSSITSIDCIVPASSTTGDSACELLLTENGLTATDSFNYQAAFSPTVTGVSPARGGTGGGTLITVTGTLFPSNIGEQLTVTIAGSECIVESVITTQIQCRTGSYSSSSITADVIVTLASGSAINLGVQFEYVDLWSSVYTWGGESLPQEGELIVIGFGQTVYFDAASTPILKGIVIQGGSLIFDDNQDVTLSAEYILIIDNGTLQIGTESAPFTHNAEIVMHGQVRSTELPIYGAKVIGVRNGTLDLHGLNNGVTWSHLGATATAGTNLITLKEDVTWPVGSEIVIATTGNKFSPGQSETAIITAVTGAVLTLDRNLEHTHLAEVRTVGTENTVDVNVRAEVGLLSRNVQFKGFNDDSWKAYKASEACPDGFNPSEHATQTCFLGRYGPEFGSDEFGATIHVSKPTGSPLKTVVVRISNVEFSHVGQSFRIGRYPIHFHLNGDMPESYVKECAIHQSFNRAVNIHGTNYITVEGNVIYDIKGGAYFLEDGIEIGNVFKYNLAVFVRTSSSLLNEDVTPAAFWATNPNNTYEHNAVAGGTHFGFWYRLTDKPEGPSFTTSYCPKKIPFGTFNNNSVHSTGRFGLWIFPGYNPTPTGACNDGGTAVAAFEYFTSWSNDKGGEFVDSNAIQFRHFTVFDNHDTGIEAKIITNNQDVNSKYKNTFYDDNLGSGILDSIVIGNSVNGQNSLGRGLTFAWDRGEVTKNVAFYNFPNADISAMDVTSIAGVCSVDCGGWVQQVSGVSFENVQFKHKLRWNWDNIIEDMDGSLTGTAGNVVIFNDDIATNNIDCTDASNEFVNGAVCSNYNTPIRFSFNNFQPDAALAFTVTNELGATATSQKLLKRLTHKLGFMMVLEANQEYKLDFDNIEKPANMSYTGTYFNVEPGNYLIIKHPLGTKPDRVIFNNQQIEAKPGGITIDSSDSNYDWSWDESTSSVHYLIKNVDTAPFVDVPVKFQAYKCRYVNCEFPKSPALRAPIAERPADALYWSNDDPIAWYPMIKPTMDGGNFTIINGTYIVADVPMPKFTNLIIEGYLELEYGMDHVLEAEVIFINGGQLIVGWEDAPIQPENTVTILLNGEKDSVLFELPSGFETLGGKSIGAYGGLDLHGAVRTVSWTRLAVTAVAGESSITLVEAVDWKVGEKITITTTSYVLEQTEVREIIAVSADMLTLTLTEPLTYDHLAYSESFDEGTGYEIAAGVGLLTRNVKVVGAEYVDQASDLFGFRILVSDYSAVTDDILLYYKGFARISNVEMEHFGQFDRGTGDDVKAGVLISNQGPFNATRPSYIKDSAFHHGFGIAIGSFSSKDILIENNVVHHTINYGIRVEDSGNKILHNLVTVNQWGSTYLTEEASVDKTYWGAIDVSKADSVIVEDNFVAGSERTGINFRGDVCPGDTLPGGLMHSIKRNTIYGASAGVLIDFHYTYDLSCIQISGFTIFKSQYYAIYYQGTGEIILDDNKLIDNQIGAFTIVYTPSALSHIITDKKYYVKNSLVVGISSGYDCAKDVYPQNITDMNNLFNTFGAGASGAGKIGLVWPQFTSGPNNMPEKPFTNMMSYNQVGGEMKVTNVSFANFGVSCNGFADYAISTSINNDDGQHPVDIELTKIFNVAEESKVFIHRPNLGKINPTDCVDMDCDGLKKNLLNDLDGSFLGLVSSVISQSEWEWGNQQRGLGDFRIPAVVMANPDGSLKRINEVYDFQGIVRDETNCTYKNEWQGYHCFGLRYEMLMIESMDSDTEKRRISPVCIQSTEPGARYLDLINGPQDHGWCNGYTCQKRISTFMALVAADRNYEITLSSSEPTRMRFTLLNTDADFKVRIGMFYTPANRIDLYKDDTYVGPTNQISENGQNVITDPEIDLATYMPTLDSPAGTNLFYKSEKRMYFTADGVSSYTLVIAPVLFITFNLPALTPEQFYSSATIVGNLALLLGVPEDMIRRVEIVNAARQVNDGLTVRFALESNAVTSLSDNAVTTVEQESRELSAQLGNMYATNQLQTKASELFSVTIEGLELNNNTVISNLQKVDSIVIFTEASGCKAAALCAVQPIIQVLDENGMLVQNLGTVEFPWIMEVTFNDNSNGDAVLSGTEVEIIGGYANFTSLSVSAIVDSFTLAYQIQPPVGINTAVFDPLTTLGVETNSTQPELTCIQLDERQIVETNELFDLTVKLADASTFNHLDNINWATNDWIVDAEIYNLTYYNAIGVMTPSVGSAVFNRSTATAVLSDLSLNVSGMYMLVMTIRNSDSTATSYCLSRTIEVRNPGDVFASTETGFEPNFILLFEGNYSAVYEDELISNAYNFLLTLGIKPSGISAAPSTQVFFWSENDDTQLVMLLEADSVTIDDSLTFQYALINEAPLGTPPTTVPIVWEVPKPGNRKGHKKNKSEENDSGKSSEEKESEISFVEKDGGKSSEEKDKKKKGGKSDKKKGK